MKYTYLKSGLFVMVAAALVLTVTAPANAFEAKLSGQINRAVLWADDGTDDEYFFVDNDNSSTRIRLTASKEMDDIGTVGFKGEWQFESNSSAKAEIIGDFDSTNSFTERHMDIWFKTQVGKISLGQGDMASNGTSEVDLSGTDVVTYSGVVDMAANISFRDPALPATDPDTGLATVEDTRSNFDGFGRDDRIRYDTTFLGPLTLSASVRQGDEYDLAARYSAELGGFGKIAAAAAYALASSTESGEDVNDTGINSDYDQISASASWLHSSGFNVTVNYAERDYDVSALEDPDTIFIKLGFKRGPHAVSVHWTTTEDLDAKGDEADTIGAGYVNSYIKGVELYAGINNYELDRDGVSSIDDVLAGMVGARVKF